MKKIKAFLYVFYKSLTSFSYYADVIKTDIKFNIKYFMILGVLASVVSSAGLTARAVPQVNKFITDFTDELNSFYPENLELKVENNAWSINMPEPFIVPFPKNVAEAAKTEEIPNGIENNETEVAADIPENLVVFYHDGTISDLETLDTLLLVNDKNVIAKNSSKIEAYPLGELPSGTINKTEFLNFTDRLKNLTGFIAPFIFVALVTGFLIYYVVLRSIYLLLIALITMIVSMFTPAKLTYLQSYQIGIHTMTLPVLIEVVVSLINYTVPIGFWFISINVGFGVAVVAFLSRKPSQYTEQNIAVENNPSKNN